MDKLAQLLELFSSLTDEEKAQLLQAGKTPETPETPESPKKRGRPKKNKLILPKGLDDPEEVVEVIHTPKKMIKKIHMEEDDDEDEEFPSEARPKGKKRKNRNSDGVTSRREPFVVGPRPNEFISSEDFNKEKHLVKEDKANLKKFGISPRAKRTTLYEVTCVRCHRDFEVGAGLAHRRYVCDSCITER